MKNNIDVSSAERFLGVILIIFTGFIPSVWIIGFTLMVLNIIKKRKLKWQWYLLVVVIGFAWALLARATFLK